MSTTQERLIIDEIGRLRRVQNDCIEDGKYERAQEIGELIKGRYEELENYRRRQVLRHPRRFR